MMDRTTVRSITTTCVALAVAFALASCSASSNSSPTPSPSSNNPRQITVVQPNAGPQPVVDFINQATKTLDFGLYEMDPGDTEIVNAAKEAKARGVAVRVLLSPTNDSPNNVPTPSKENQQDVAQFNQLGFQAKVANVKDFPWYHEKAIIVDGAQPGGKAMIMDFNLAEGYMSTEQSPYDPNEGGTRGMAAVDTDPADVENIQKTFDADFNYVPWAGSNRPDLVWAPAGSKYSPPGNAIKVFQNLISSATKSIDAYIQVFNYETKSINLPYLLEAAKRGVKIRIITNKGGFTKAEAYTSLKAAGAEIVMQPTSYADSSKYLYIHTKTIVFDAGEPNQVAFVGSENPFIDDSLNIERELGVLIRDANSINTAMETFNRDFGASQPYVVPTPSATPK